MTFRGTDRRNFTRKQKLIAIKRANGHCQGCTAPLSPGHYTVDHIIPWELSRDSSLSNAQVLCDTCDPKKTGSVDLPRIRKSDRQRDKHIGAMERSRTPLPCGRGSRMKKQIGGRVIPRVSQREKMRAYLAGRAQFTNQEGDE